MAVVVVALHRGLFDGAVHTFDLAVRPGMIGFGQPMMDAVHTTAPVKRVTTKPGGWSSAVLRQVSELDAVIGEHGVDAIRNSRDKVSRNAAAARMSPTSA